MLVHSRRFMVYSMHSGSLGCPTLRKRGHMNRSAGLPILEWSEETKDSEGQERKDDLFAMPLPHNLQFQYSYITNA